MPSPEYSVIIAAHNEEASIGKLLEELLIAIEPLKHYEIFVSEDGSRDNTREVINKIIKREPRIRISNQSVRKGYSGAIQHGIAESLGEILLFLDGDGQTDPKNLIDLLPHLINKKQIIVGYRNPRVDSKLRVVQSKLFNLFYVLIGFPKLKDPSSGSVVCYRESVYEIANKNLHLPFGFWWEFQAWVNNKGYQVIEKPVPHRPRIAGSTQVYLTSKIFLIALKHLKGLLILRNELKK